MSEDKNLQNNEEKIDFDSLFDDEEIQTWGENIDDDSYFIAGCQIAVVDLRAEGPRGGGGK